MTSTTTFPCATTGTYNVTSYASTFPLAHDADGLTPGGSSSLIQIHTTAWGPACSDIGAIYEISHSYATYDTTTLGGQRISTARINISSTPSSIRADGAEYCRIYVFPSNHELPIVSTDFPIPINETTLCGELSWASWYGGQYYINLNSNGINQINKNGNTKFSICLYGDYYNIAPTGVNNMGLRASSTSFTTLTVTHDYSFLILECAFYQSIFSDPATATWTDVTDELMALHTKRGRMHELDRIEAGTAEFTLKNISGNWYRYNTSGAYYTSTSEAIKPLTLIRLRSAYAGIEYPLWYGVTESIEPGWATDMGGKVPIATLECVDLFKSLNRFNVPSTTTFSLEYSGTRVDNVLDAIGWATTTRSIDTGIVYVTALLATEGGTNAMEHLYRVSEAEGGVLLQSPSGTIAFQDKNARQESPYATSAATFAPTTDSLYVIPHLADDDTFIYNIGAIQSGSTGTNTTSIYYDASSISLQGERTWVKSTTLIRYEEDGFDQAYTAVKRYNDSKLRCKNLVIYPDASPSVLYPEVFGYDIGTRITLNLNNTDNPYAIPDFDYHIEGIEHFWNATDNIWETRWQLWDVDQFRILKPNYYGFAQAVSTDYTNTHDAVVANEVFQYPSTNYVWAGQRSTSIPSEYTVHRGLMTWDTTAVPTTSNIVAANLLLWQQSDLTIGNAFSLVVCAPGSSWSPVTVTTYADMYACTVSCGSVAISTGVLSGGTLMEISLNTTGIDNIILGATTTFVLRSDHDITSVPPGTSGSLVFEYFMVDGVAQNARLVLTIS